MKGKYNNVLFRCIYPLSLNADVYDEGRYMELKAQVVKLKR